MNINYILEKKLCSGCGMCKVQCPIGSITIKRGDKSNYPIIDNRCIECEQCLKVCPGYTLLDRIKSGQLNEIFTNRMNEIFVGHSNNENIRFNAASGGVITSILLYLIEENLIDGAVITKGGNNPFENESFIATTREEIINSSGSRYNQVSTCEVINKAIISKKRIVFVGKPCNIEALNNYIKVNKLDAEGKLIKISMMCAAQTFNDNILTLLKDEGINAKDVKAINFRGSGWPGYFNVELNDGSEYKKPYMEAWNEYFSKYYGEKCDLCDDSLSVNADIVVGDPWSEEYEKETIGKSLFFARTELGNSILEGCIKDKVIKCKTYPWNTIVDFQKNLYSKYCRLPIEHKSFRVVYDNEKIIKLANGLELIEFLKLIKKTVRKRKYINKKYYK